MSVYGWSVCLLAWARRRSFAEQLFPGYVVIVEEGDLGFLLKSRRAEHLFKEALGAGGEGGSTKRAGGERQDGPTASDIKDPTRQGGTERERESDMRK